MLRPLARPPFTIFLTARSQCRQETLAMTLPTCSIRDIAITERDKQLLADLRRASAMATPRSYAIAWAEGLWGGAIRGHQSWAVLCRHRCRLLLAEIP